MSTPPLDTTNLSFRHVIDGKLIGSEHSDCQRDPEQMIDSGRFQSQVQGNWASHPALVEYIGSRTSNCPSTTCFGIGSEEGIHFRNSHHSIELLAFNGKSF
ncbi:hypothetical protein MW887_008342 [Aspergillus wentii]|nr:hypothetical protein MW887_008342 [Aspergillus wentii]